MSLTISVVIPTWNRPLLLERALQSIRKAKKNHEIEVIVVDNASNPPVVISGFEDLNINLLRLEQNYGPSIARNLGIQKAKYNLVFPLDDDDELTEDALDIFSCEQSITYLNKIPVVFFACTTSKLQQNIEIYDLEDYINDPPQEVKPLINKFLFLKKGLAYPNFRIGAESLLWLRVAKEFDIITIDQVVTTVHHDAQLRLTDTKNQIDRASEYMDFQKEAILLLMDKRKKFLEFYQKKILGYLTYAVLSKRKLEALKFLRGKSVRRDVPIRGMFLFLIPSYLCIKLFCLYRGWGKYRL